MKKIASILLLIFYLIPVAGFSITTHFCAGELRDVSLYSLEAEKCICGTDKINSGCCSSNTTILKINDTQRKEASFTMNLVKSLTRIYHFFNASFSIGQEGVALMASPPENPQHTSISIFIRVLRI